MGCGVPPGDIQTDTVAHCGGDMGGNFWWTLTATDRKTQWTELQPVWNRGMYATRMTERFPEKFGAMRPYLRTACGTPSRSRWPLTKCRRRTRSRFMV